MSNRIQIRRGTNAERLLVILANGEPCWCTDTLQMYIGDGVTAGGRPVRSTDMTYARNAFSYRFNEQTDVKTVIEALDDIFKFTTSVSTNFYYGDVATKVIADIPSFFLGLNMIQDAGTGPKDISYISENTYRVFAYPKALGTLAGVQDPNFGYTDLTGTYDIPAVEVAFSGITFLIYFTTATNLNGVAKTIRYIL